MLALLYCASHALPFFKLNRLWLMGIILGMILTLVIDIIWVILVGALLLIFVLLE